MDLLTGTTPGGRRRFVGAEATEDDAPIAIAHPLDATIEYRLRRWKTGSRIRSSSSSQSAVIARVKRASCWSRAVMVGKRVRRSAGMRWIAPVAGAGNLVYAGKRKKFQLKAGSSRWFGAGTGAWAATSLRSSTMTCINCLRMSSVSGRSLGRSRVGFLRGEVSVGLWSKSSSWNVLIRRPSWWEAPGSINRWGATLWCHVSHQSSQGGEGLAMKSMKS